MARAKKRDDGLYQRCVTVGRKADGRPDRKVIYAHTQKELEDKVAEYKERLSNGMLPIHENATFGEFAELLCKEYKPTISESVRKQYVSICNNHLSELKYMQLTELRNAHLQTIINRMARNGYSTKLMSHVKQVASQVLRLAQDNDILVRNVFERVKVPSIEPEKRLPLTEEQIALVKKTYKGHRMGVPVMVMLYAGLRRGELLALQWTDIDFKKHVIRVWRSLAFEAKNQARIKKPKTKAGTREVPIVDPLYEILTEAKKNTTSVMVCPSAKGTVMTDTAWKTSWDSYMHYLNIQAGGRDRSRSNPKVVAIEPFTPHQLRHTFITMCHEAGVDVKVTQEIAGHADIHTTLMIYTHLTNAKREEGVQTLNAHLLGKKAEPKTEAQSDAQ
ncbi:MAG: site-specific integrase [Clostridia bacterium]|nr:site-specific integrase [Clostridia bacterium]